MNSLTQNLPTCPYCGDFYSPERKAIGKTYCMKDKCVAIALSQVKWVEVGYGKNGVDLKSVNNFDSEELKNTGNRGRS